MKYYITTLLCLLICTKNYSQKGKVYLGPEIGMNIIPIENTEIGHNYQLGYHLGGHLKYHFSEKFKLSTGIFLSQKKKAYSSSSTSSVLNSFDNLLGFGGMSGGIDTLGLDSLMNIPGLNMDMTENVKGVSSELFIEIPILVNFKLNHFNMYFGPYVGFLVSANSKEEITTDIPVLDVIDLDAIDPSGLSTLFLPSSGTTNSSKSGTDGLRSIDFGINAGIGYEINDLHFNLMYSHGLFDYRDDNNNEATETLKTIRISILYLFDLKKKETENNARFE
jgi:hypothetical protein